MLLRIGLSVRMFLRIGHDVSSGGSSDWFECTNVSSVCFVECTNVSSDCVFECTNVSSDWCTNVSSDWCTNVASDLVECTDVSSDWSRCEFEGFFGLV